MDFLELCKNRYSVRRYSEREVEQDKIDKIQEAAKLAPTACNFQPQRIYVLKSEKAKEKLSSITRMTYGAPVHTNEVWGISAVGSASHWQCGGHGSKSS